jgi:hypothetical protein
VDSIAETRETGNPVVEATSINVDFSDESQEPGVNSVNASENHRRVIECASDEETTAELTPSRPAKKIKKSNFDIIANEMAETRQITAQVSQSIVEAMGNITPLLRALSDTMVLFPNLIASQMSQQNYLNQFPSFNSTGFYSIPNTRASNSYTFQNPPETQPELNSNEN